MNIADRKHKVETLLEGFRTMRRCFVFGAEETSASPRITASQWGVLMLIAHHGQSTVKDVSLALGITSSAATQLIDGLVKNAYVTREADPNDRRAVSLTLSNKSKNQVEKMKKQAVQKFLRAFAVLDDAEFEQYYALNKKIVDSFKSKKV